MIDMSKEKRKRGPLVVAHCTFKETSAQDGHCVVLYSVVVAKAMRRRGVGRYLMKCVEKLPVRWIFRV